MKRMRQHSSTRRDMLIEVDEGVDAADVGFRAAELWGIGGVRQDGEAEPCGEVGLNLGGFAVVHLSAWDGSGRVVV